MTVLGEGLVLLTLAFIPAVVICLNIAFANLIDSNLMDNSLLRFAGGMLVTFLLIAGMIIAGIWYPKKHDWWDVAAGAAMGIGSAYIFTRPFAQKHNLTLSPLAGPDLRTALRLPLSLTSCAWLLKQTMNARRKVKR